MKLAFVSPYPPSQVTLNEYGYHLIRSFIGKPGIDEIYVLTNHLDNDADYERYACAGIEIIPCWKFNDWKATWSIQKKLKELKPDAVVSNLQFMTFGSGKIQAALGLFTPWMCRLIGIPSVVILHNITETVKLETIGMADKKWKGKLFLWIGEQLTKIILQADVVGVTISQYVTILKEKYKENNVVLLPHGNFELPDRKPLLEPLSKIELMAFGKFGTYKKVEVMLDAVKLLEKKYPSLNFSATVAGTDNPNVKGYIDGVKEQYKEMRNVKYTGYVPEEAVSDIFHDSTFVVFPYTTTTGSSGILHQAGSYGRACILPKIDDLERVVEEEGYDGAFFNTDDADSLAEAVASLVENPEKRRQIEDKNYAAAKGLPMSELAEWYLSHIYRLTNFRLN
ncbi:glycosyltransferase [Echinicola sp. CAU 1574]|uniref:Glycosyltransferase n=1 Tax=Echinicola arenosa TaxID=2774144 RepID=A0ABR9AJT9_9BACT|nr:glycosyltransferase [Echinicola arenosa]MBD8488980.1 glycosyltransferase [Echinicola arenosa]